MIETIVLAAGRSQRMGIKNKLLLPFQNKAILLHTIDALLASKVDRIIVVVGHERDRIEDLLKSKKVEIVEHLAYRKGQLTSIQKGLSQLSDTCTAFMVCLSDMPLLTSEDYNELIQTYTEQNTKSSIVVPHNNIRAGNPKIFDIPFKDHILSLNPKEHQGAKQLLVHYSENVIYHRTEKNSFFFDVDTPTSYETLLSKNQ